MSPTKNAQNTICIVTIYVALMIRKCNHAKIKCLREDIMKPFTEYIKYWVARQVRKNMYYFKSPNGYIYYYGKIDKGNELLEVVFEEEMISFPRKKEEVMKKINPFTKAPLSSEWDCPYMEFDGEYEDGDYYQHCSHPSKKNANGVCVWAFGNDIGCPLNDYYETTTT